MLAEPFQGKLWLLLGLQQRPCPCLSGTQHQNVLGGQTENPVSGGDGFCLQPQQSPACGPGKAHFQEGASANSGGLLGLKGPEEHPGHIISLPCAGDLGQDTSLPAPHLLPPNKGSKLEPLSTFFQNPVFLTQNIYNKVNNKFNP